MRALHIQKSLLIAAAIVLLAAQAQAQELCTGAGIHQSCLNKSGNGYTYNHSGKTTQVNSNNGAKAGTRLYHDAEKNGRSTIYNQPAFSTTMTTAKSVRNSQLYNGINTNQQTMQK